jgi:hypothetical protein
MGLGGTAHHFSLARNDEESRLVASIVEYRTGKAEDKPP